MQNISLLSFFAHVIINIFFWIKRKVFSGQINSVFVAPRPNETLSFALIGLIIYANISQFVNTIDSNIDNESGYKQLVSLLENQHALAQNTTPLYVRSLINKNYSVPETACNTCRFDFAPHPQTATSGQLATKINSKERLRQTTIETGDTMWSAIKRILMDYIDQNPCGDTNPKVAACLKIFDQKLNESVFILLSQNGFVAPNGISADLRPGQTVWMDISGTIWIDRQPDLPYSES